MTIKEALQSITVYPIPDNQIELVCLERELTSTDAIDKTIAESQAYQLAKADLYLWLATAFAVSEQEVSFNLSRDEKTNFLNLANAIYGEYDDPKFTGEEYGFIGDDYNG